MFRTLFPILIGAAVVVRASGPSAADMARSIHEAVLDPSECYRVRDLSFRKDDIRIYFTDGYLIFSKPAAGQLISAVFTTEVEGGDGEVILLPPTRGERQSLAAFTQSPNLDEHMVAAMLVFTDGTGDMLRERIEKEAAGKKVPEVGALMADKWSSVLANIRDGFELRMVDDLFSPDPKKSGFTFLAVAGRERGNFDLLYDPRAREQVVAGQLADHASRLRYNIWTSFMSRSVRTGGAKRIEPGFALTHFSIDAALDANLHMKASTTVNLRVGKAALRSFPFEISGAMKVTSVRVDGAPAELFTRDSVREQALHGSEDDALLVVTPDALSPASEHKFSFEHEGDVITSAGNGVYFVGARSTWYPRSAPEFSTYDLTFHYPKKLTLVTAGDLVDDRTDGDTRITRRSTAAPIRFAGFNLGNYERITGSAPGFNVEVYGNRRPGNCVAAQGRDESGGPSCSPAYPARPRGTSANPCSSARSAGAPSRRLGRRLFFARIFLRLVRSARAEDTDDRADSRNVRTRFPGLGVPVHHRLSRSFLPSSAFAQRESTTLFFRPDRRARSRPSMVGQCGDCLQLPGRVADGGSGELLSAPVARKKERGEGRG